LATLSITLNRYGPGPEFGGFEFLIHYEPQLLTMVGAEPGELLDSSAWEYFSYQTESLAPGVVAIRLTAVADVAGNGEQPSSYLAGMTGTLARLQFLAATNPDIMCYFFPVNFYWAECSDNSLTAPSGDSLFVAFDVEDYYEWDPPVPPTSLPSSYGLPDSCLAGPIAGATPGRQLSFRHGGVDFFCTDTVDQRGDMNLNGIANEIADYVLYMNYHLYGLAALDPNPQFQQAQIAASDVNGDSVPLTFRDLVYLYRVIIGDALPIPKGRPSAPTAAFVQNPVAKFVSVEHPGFLAGARFVFTGNIVPSFVIPDGGLQGHAVVFDGTHTRVIVEPNQPSSFPSGVWFTYTGEGTLDSVATADWFDSDIPAQILVISEPGGCGDVNADQKTNISDIVYLIRFIFEEGAPPFDIHQGDVDCDALVTISDVVYLVNFIFSGGPAPCANCP